MQTNIENFSLWYAIPYHLFLIILVSSVMAKSKEQIYIQLKYALAFRKLMNEHRLKWLEGDKGDNIMNSFDKLDSSTRLRKATLLDIFWGKSNPSATSIVIIIEALGKTYAEFGSIYDNITEKEIQDFKRLISQRQKRGNI